MADSKKLMEDYIKTLNKDVQNNVKIVSKDDLKFPFFLHLADQKNPKYSFRVPNNDRQCSNEDRTVPRITVAPSILGCLYGYGSLLVDVFYGKFEANKNEHKWAGGLYIQKIPFEHALKPSKRMVSDSHDIDEHWVVKHDPESHDVETTNIGKVFVKSMTIEPNNSKNKNTVVMYLSTTEEIMFSASENLAAGYYRIEIPHNRDSTWKTKDGITISSVTKSEFDEANKYVASNLSVSNQPKKPLYSSWAKFTQVK